MGVLPRGFRFVVAGLAILASWCAIAQETDPYRDLIVSSNPVAYWPLESKQYVDVMGNFPSLSEGDNLSIKDTGLNIGSAVETFSRWGNLSFNSDMKPFNDVFSFGVWVKVYSLGGRQVVFQQGGASDDDKPFSLFIAGRDESYESGDKQRENYFTFFSGESSVLLSDIAPVELDVWNYLVVTIDNDESRLYRNGVLVDQGPGRFTDSAEEKFYIGDEGHDVSRLNGFVADVAIYDDVIEPSEVNRQYLLGGEEPSREPVLLTEDLHISAINAEYEGAAVVVDGAIVTIDGTHSFKRLEVINGAKVTHSVEQKLELVVAETLRVSSNSSIDVTGRGLTTTSSIYYGASHGGAGAGRSSDSTYGDFEEPTSLGTSSYSAARGGGAIRIQAAEAIIDGSIIADGPKSSSYGGTSGGSVWLEANTLSGVGTISAKGGASGNSSSYYGGAGGRVAVYYAVNNGFNLDNISAVGGASYSASKPVGGAGTIYWKDTTSGKAIVRILGTPEDDAKSLLRGPIKDSTTLEVVLADTVLDTASTNNGSEATGRNVIVDGGTLSLSPSPLSHPSEPWENVSILNGGNLTHEVVNPDQDGPYIGFDWAVGQLRVDADSRIDVTGRGHTTTSSIYYGASHGGAGAGRSSDSTYGDFEEPTSLGTSSYSAARGGGAIRIQAAEAIIDGSIIADGPKSSSYGGTSGGSVWLEANTLSGVGTISAKGGASGNSSSYYGGAGGRVAVYYAVNNGFNLDNISAVGGASYSASKPVGGAGTIYWKDTTSGKAIVRILGTPEDDEKSLLRGPIKDDTTLEVVLADAVLDVSSTGNGDEAVGRNLLVDGKGAGAALSFYAVPLSKPSEAWEKVSLVEGGVLQHEPPERDASEPFIGINWIVDQLNIDADSKIDVTGRGFGSSFSDYYGASNCGVGGGWDDPPIYENIEEPTSFGSSRSASVRGGGSVKLVVGDAALNGAIVASGQTPDSYGGPSGGSIWITTNTLSGAGYIAANGGNGGNSTSYYGGGGGCIALYYGVNENFDLDLISADGGSSNSSSKGGQDGSVYILSSAPVVRSLDIGANVNRNLESLSVRFGSGLDFSSVDVDDLTLQNDSGVSIPIVSIDPTSISQFKVFFAETLLEGVYTFTVGPNIFGSNGLGMDQDQDGIELEPFDDKYTFAFKVDTTAPGKPIIDQLVAPEVNISNSRDIVLSGKRDENTAIWIDGTEFISNGSGIWSGTYSAAEGSSSIAVSAVDLSGNASEPVSVLFDIDSTAPDIVSAYPNGLYNVAPMVAALVVTETGSGIDLDTSTLV
ncbi:LamG domain-containing protein, partial [Microbulbifer elongatus]|nr:LamG domain-containing protein [Microbulbifer elongatus]